MSPQTDGDYKKLLSDLIKKQIIILGPTIAIAKARNVKELTINDDGVVTEIKGDTQQATQQLIEQFMELSGLIVRKTMEPLLSNFPGLAQTMTNAVQAQAQAMVSGTAIPQTATPAPVATPAQVATPTPTTPPAPATPVAQPTPQSTTSTPPPSQPAQPAPAIQQPPK